MGRQPKARDIVLDAAEQLVKEHGAGSLTFERLAEVSGVTRGGITYHFPTKLALLEALVERDIGQWKAVTEELAPRRAMPTDLAQTLGQLRTCCAEDEDHQRLVAGLIAAAVHEPELLGPVRAFYAARYDGRAWTDRELKLFVIDLAADGLFWQGVFDIYGLPDDVRPRLNAMLEQLAETWSQEGQGVAAECPASEMNQGTNHDDR